MKILLTGATGLVGTATGLQLVRSGHDVIAVSRNPAAAAAILPYPATHMSWSELQAGDLPVVDAVIHLAGESVFGGPWTANRRRQIKSSRIESTGILIKAFAKRGAWPKVWLNASAIGYYGDVGDSILTEESPLGNGFLADVCHAWENTTSEISRGCRVVKLRFGVVLAEHGGALASMLPAFRAGIAGRLGAGTQWMSWVHIDDVAGAILHVLNADDLSGPINVVAPEPVINRIFTSELSRKLKRPAILPVPKAVLKLAGEISSLFLASQRVLPGVLLKHGYQFKFPNLETALSGLLDFQRGVGVHELFQQQWVPRPVDELFPFFCDEKNLETLTPPLLNFKVIGKTTPDIAVGTLIDYNLKIRGVPTTWRTKILEWEKGKKFVDTQLRGPYALWHHTHEFESLGSGTLMTDRVLYKLPFYPFGELGLPLVKNDVKSIFAYRRKIIQSKFGSS